MWAFIVMFVAVVAFLFAGIFSSMAAVNAKSKPDAARKNSIWSAVICFLGAVLVFGIYFKLE
jgi:Na+/proline symporter